MVQDRRERIVTPGSGECGADGTATGAHGRLGVWSGPLAWSLSLAACYGVLAVLPLLAALGLSVTPNATAWAAAIMLFVLLAVAAVAPGRRRHGHAWPVVLSVVAASLLAWVMFASFDRALELLGFALLGVSVGADAWLRRRTRRH